MYAMIEKVRVVIDSDINLLDDEQVKKRFDIDMPLSELWKSDLSEEIENEYKNG